MSRIPLTLRQSVALVWRTLRSMRTALDPAADVGAGVGDGLVDPPMAELARARGPVPARPRVCGQFLAAGRAVRRVRLVVVRADHGAAVRVAGGVSDPTDAGADPGAALPGRCRRARSTPSATTSERTVAAPPVDGARRVAPRAAPAALSGWRADPERPALAAEKGVLRELGSLLFHWAFILILVGVVYGKGTGFSGYAVVVEGDTWIDAAANYDGQIRTGRFFDGRLHGDGPAAARVRERFPGDRPTDGLRVAGRPARPRRVDASVSRTSA